MAMSIVGLILGILALVGCWWGVASFGALVMAIVGLALSCVARGKNPTGLNKAGKIIGIIAVILSAVLACTCGLCSICTCLGCGACSSCDLIDTMSWMNI